MIKYSKYKDNPNLRFNKVKLFDGTTEYKLHTIMYKGIYLDKYIHCNFIDGEYVIKDDVEYIVELYVAFPKNNKNEIYDYETKKVVEKTEKHIYGIIDFDDNKPIYGWYSKNNTKNTILYLTSLNKYENVHDFILLRTNKYFLSANNGKYYNKILLDKESIEMLSNKTYCSPNVNNYNIVDNMQELKTSIEEFNSADILIDKDIKYISKYIKNYTFGVEFEACNGLLPKHILSKYGIIICRDGSTGEDGYYPPEYVTIPLNGAKGLQALRDVCEYLSYFSDINEKCSLHIHLGGFNITKIGLISLVKLCQLIQNQVFDMFPYYKQNEIKFGGKKKNYCRKLPIIISDYKNGDFKTYLDKSYLSLYNFLSGLKGFDNNYNFAKKNNPWGGHKWNIKSRYYWLNITNLAFGKQETVEFRVHEPTFNFDKLIGWLLMCISIVEYANNTPSLLRENRVNFRRDVLSILKKGTNSKYINFVINNLKSYYDERCKYFTNCANNGDYLSKEYIENDERFKFNIINYLES